MTRFLSAANTLLQSSGSQAPSFVGSVPAAPSTFVTPSAPQSSGVSKSTVIAEAVGISLAGCLLVVLAVFLVLRLRARRPGQTIMQSPDLEDQVRILRQRIEQLEGSGTGALYVNEKGGSALEKGGEAEGKMEALPTYAD